MYSFVCLTRNRHMCASTVYCIFDAAAYRRARDVKEQDILDKFAF